MYELIAYTLPLAAALTLTGPSPRPYEVSPSGGYATAQECRLASRSVQLRPPPWAVLLLVCEDRSSSAQASDASWTRVTLSRQTPGWRDVDGAWRADWSREAEVGVPGCDGFTRLRTPGGGLAYACMNQPR